MIQYPLKTWLKINSLSLDLIVMAADLGSPSTDIRCAAQVDLFTELVHYGVLYFCENSRWKFRPWIAKFWLEESKLLYLYLTETVAMHCNGRNHYVC